MLHEDVCVLRMRNVPKFSSSFCVWLISRLIFASQIQKISHHSQWILTMGRISSTSLHSTPLLVLLLLLLILLFPLLIFQPGENDVDDDFADAADADEVATKFLLAAPTN